MGVKFKKYLALGGTMKACTNQRGNMLWVLNGDEWVYLAGARKYSVSVKAQVDEVLSQFRAEPADYDEQPYTKYFKEDKAA